MGLRREDISANEVIDLYDNGCGLKKIAKIYNSSDSTIKKILIKNGIKIKEPPNHKNIKQQTELIIDLYNDKISISEIARKIGCSDTIVSKILKNNNIQKKDGKHDHLVPKIIELYNTGLSCQKISEKINVCGATIRFLLKKNGIKTRRGKWIEEKDKIKTLYKNKVHMLDIGKQIGCSDVTVARILKQNNVDIKSYTGENNKAWKGGITPLHNLIRNSISNKEWKINCFIRAKRISEINKNNKNLQCHHIYGFQNILQSSVMKHKFLENEMFRLGLINDNRFYDIDNGLVIEKEEHEKIEASNRDANPYWKIWQAFPEFALQKFNFTKEQYLSFNENGQLNAQDAKVVVSNITKKIKRIIRYEHYLGTIPPHKIILIAEVNGIIAGIAIFGQGANKNIPKDCWELTRLCVPYYVVRPFTIKFLNMCIDYIKENHPEIKELISFADPNVGHDGAIYRMAGWKKEGYTNPSYCYFDPNINQLKHKSYCRRIKGIDKTELELANERGLIKINLLPKKKYSICLRDPPQPTSEPDL